MQQIMVEPLIPGSIPAKYWVDRVMENGKEYGVFADYRYYGTGDIGGAPSETAS
jgi:hypothetical protein